MPRKIICKPRISSIDNYKIDVTIEFEDEYDPLLNVYNRMGKTAFQKMISRRLSDEIKTKTTEKIDVKREV